MHFYNMMFIKVVEKHYLRNQTSRGLKNEVREFWKEFVTKRLTINRNLYHAIRKKNSPHI